ncbi:MAG: ABC transporter substrate-binding protein, partial [Candidatus Binatia bacterium]
CFSSPVAAAAPKGAPAKMKVAFVDFLSGPGATFGIAGKWATSVIVSSYNKKGGIGGVPIEVIWVDEAKGTARVVTEFRRLVLDEKVDAIVGVTSSGNSLAIAPVADELKVLTIVHVAGTHQLQEKGRMGKGQYTFRTSNNQASDSVILARWVMANKPNVKSIAGIQPDYSWGRDCWGAFRIAMERLQPNIKIKAELWPKLFAGEFSAEISRLLATRADVIHTSLWGADLVTFTNQAIARGLFKQSTVLLSVGESILQLVPKVPDGTVALPRLTAGYFLDPDPKTDPAQKEFVEAFYKESGNKQYPYYAAYRTQQAWAGLKAAYEKAIDILGRWPTTEEVIKVFEGLSYEAIGGSIVMREDHQAITGGVMGITKFSKKHGFPILVDRQRFSAGQVTPPLGVATLDWVRSLK